jgi:hypothetical protein
VVQQHSLADARLTAYYQGPALTGLDGLDQPVKLVAFAEPVRQPRRPAQPPWMCGHRPGARPLPGGLVSGGLLALERFGGVHLPAGEGMVMATYASAQALLAG